MRREDLDGISMPDLIAEACLRYWHVLYLSINQYKNSSGDEIANVNFCTTTTYMERPAPTPIEPLLSTINIYGT